jgi:hypothetical protein
MFQKFENASEVSTRVWASCKVQSTKCNPVNIMQRAKCKPVNIVWLFEFIKNGLFWFFGKKNDNKKPSGFGYFKILKELMGSMKTAVKNWQVSWKNP